MTYPRRAKPPELVGLHGLAAELFDLLRDTFDVPRTYELALHDVDGHEAPSYDHERVIAALAMREAQSLRRAAADGVRVTNADVVNVAAALHVAIDSLVARPAGQPVEPVLRESRDRINQAARVAAALGQGVDGGIVELH